MPNIAVQDLEFEIYIEEQQIRERIKELALRISIDYHGLDPLILTILNGAFIFSADLVRHLDIPCELSFIKVSSYAEMVSTGKVTELIGLAENTKGRHIIIVEDIVDTGRTLSEVLAKLKVDEPASIEIATLLSKPKALKFDITPKYVAFEIPDRFVVGYGLDYNGYGRNLSHIYKLVED